MTMGPHIKTLILILLLLFSPSSAGRVKGFRNGVNPANPLGEATIQRKVTAVDAMLDYEKPGPNPRHDQGKGKPGSGVGNP